MKLKAYIAALHAVLFAFLLAVSPAGSGSMLLLGAGKPTAAAGGCSQATAFLARTSGLDGTHTTAYTNFICGLVTDGLITGTMAGSGSGATACGSKFDAIYIWATQDATTAQYNLCSTSYPSTNSGGTHTIDTGYKATSTSDVLDTGFNAQFSGPNYSQDSAHFGLWQVTNTAHGNPSMGASNGGTHMYTNYSGDSLFYGRLNDSTTTGVATGSNAGFFIGNRSGASATQEYYNGASAGSGSVSSSAPPSASIYFLRANGGSADLNINYAGGSFGASLNSTEAGNFYTRLRTYMTAVGVP